MIDFAPAMTLSSAPVAPMCKTIGKLIAKITFLFFLMLQFSFSTHAQCSYELDKNHFDGQVIDLSRLNKSKSFYWFSFTAISNKMYFEVETSGDISVSLGEAIKDDCTQASITSRVEAMSVSRGNINKTSTNKLVPGKKYLIAIGGDEVASENISFVHRELVVSKREEISASARCRNVRKQVVPVEPEQTNDQPAYTGDVALVRSGKAKQKSKPREQTREQLEQNMERLKKRIAAYELNPDQNAGELNKMKMALANWVERLETID